jgi:hypothetical protein
MSILSATASERLGRGDDAVARDAAGGVGGARRAARRHLMPGKKRRLTRGDVAVIAAIAIGLLVSFVALIQWESSRECIRWSTRFDAVKGGGMRRTEVCAEFRPRRDRKADDQDRGGQR